MAVSRQVEVDGRSMGLDVRDYVHRQELIDLQSVAHDLALTAGVGLWLPLRS